MRDYRKVASGLILPTATAAMMGSALAAPAILQSPLIMTGYYANVLTRLIPDLFAGLEVVSRELVGMIPAVRMVAGAERAALGEDVVYPIAPAMAAVDNTPAMTVPEPPDRTIANNTMKITKSRVVPFGFVGEEQRGLNNGPGYVSLQAQMFAQALRTLTNEIEADLVLEAYQHASRAYGTPGTTPFAVNGDISPAAQLRKILADNGAPMSDLAMVVNTATGANLRSMYQLTKVNEAGSQLTLRQGSLLDISGFVITESGQAGTHTKGTGINYTSSAAGFPIGTTIIPLITGTGTVLPGDVITFAGDANKYVVAAGIAAPGSITIGGPGLRQALPAVATAMTIGDSYAINVGFSQSAMGMVARPPAIPEEGDLASETFLLTDVRSGMTFDVRIYLGYKKVRYEVGLAWGFKALQDRHIAVLQG